MEWVDIRFAMDIRFAVDRCKHSKCAAAQAEKLRC